MVADGETGLLVPAGEPEPLAAALNALLRDPDRAAAMGQAGRKRAIGGIRLARHCRPDGGPVRRIDSLGIKRPFSRSDLPAGQRRQDLSHPTDHSATVAWWRTSTGPGPRGACCRSTWACRRTWPGTGRRCTPPSGNGRSTGRGQVRRLNIDGDGQGDLAGHGGEHRAVFVYQIESYRYWQEQLGRDDFELRPVRRELHGQRPGRRPGVHRGPLPDRRGAVRGDPAAGDLLPGGHPDERAADAGAAGRPTTGPGSTSGCCARARSGPGTRSSRWPRGRRR